jgi:hypothetical protein
MRIVYLAAALAGVVLSWLDFARFIADFRPSLPAFFREMRATSAASGLVWDLIFTGLAGSAFNFAEARRLKIPRAWAYVALVWVVGVCAGVPLFLARRERAL